MKDKLIAFVDQVIEMRKSQAERLKQAVETEGPEWQATFIKSKQLEINIDQESPRLKILLASADLERSERDRVIDELESLSTRVDRAAYATIIGIIEDLEKPLKP